MPYRASLGGEFGGGVQRRQGEGIDISGAIDALTGGASSLIHAAYIRRQATAQLERQARQDAQAQANADREFGLKQEDQHMRAEELRRKALVDGITPGSEGGMTLKVVPDAPVAQAPVGSIRDAMTRGMTAPAEPTSSLQRPVNLGSVPKLEAGQEDPTPTSYDPTKAAAYVRATETARIRGEVSTEIQQKRAEAQQAGRVFMAQAARDLARLKAGLGTGTGKGGIQKVMTGNKMEDAREKAAIGMIGQSNGSYDEAEALLHGDTPEAKSLRELGVTARHLMFAREKYLTGATTQALRLQSGALGATPEEATGAVTQTRELIRGKKPPAPSAAAGDPSDDEIVAAMKAGMKTPAEVRAWVAKHKGKK